MSMMDNVYKSPVWSSEELDFLIKHWNQPGWTPARIAAEKPGPVRSKNACTMKASYMTLTDNKVPGNLKYSHMYDRVYLLAAQDYTLGQILVALKQEFGLSPSKPWVLKTLRRKPEAYQRWLARRDVREKKRLEVSHEEA